MKKFSFFILFMALALVMPAQESEIEVAYGDTEKYKDAHFKNIVAERDGYLFTIGADIKNPYYTTNKDQEIFLRKYSNTSLLLVEEWAFENEEFGRAKMKYTDQVVNDGHINILLEGYNRKTDRRVLGLKQLSFDGELEKVRTLISEESRGELIIRFSPDSTKTMVYRDLDPYSETESTPKIYVFDQNFDMLWSGLPRFSIEEGYKLKPVELAVSNAGEAFILGYQGLTKEMRNDGFITKDYVLLKTNREDENLHYKLEKHDLKIYGAGLSFDKNGDLILNAFYSSPQGRRIEGNMFLLLDKENLTEMTLRTELLAASVTEKIYPPTWNFFARGFQYYRFREFRWVGDQLFVVAEQFYQQGEDNSANVEQFAQSIILLQLSRDGVLREVYAIQRNTEVLEGLSEYYMHLGEGKVYLFFNDHEENPELRSQGQVPKSPIGLGALKATLNMAIISAGNTISYNEILNKETLGKAHLFLTSGAFANNKNKLFGFALGATSNKVTLVEFTLP